MDRLVKARKITRAGITRTINKLNEELGKEETDRQMVLVFHEEINRLTNSVAHQDEAIMDTLLDENAADDILNKENDEINGYREKLILAEIKIEDYLKSFIPMSDLGSNRSPVPTIIMQNQSNRTYKLPKIEIKKFNGELLGWLSFWSQFEKIHNDKALHDSDKFQYLSQAMAPDTRAAELVNSYPQTEDNYPKVISALKDRFGKEKILKQVYVRELIKMIILNDRSKEKVDLSKLYDNLESHIRALESLKVTEEQMSEFLFPMVESSLPEEILIAWQRSPTFGKNGALENPPRTELHFLMQFLKQEVESEQQRSLGRAGFSSTKAQNDCHSQQKRHIKTQGKIPTAASLYVGDTNLCIFCEKTHSPQDSRKAMDMSLKEKRDFLAEKKACQKCLKMHGTHRCRAWVKCSGCSKQHFHVLCPDSPKNKVSTTSNNCNYINHEPSQASAKQVLLKTILVKIKTNSGIKTVRALFDDGSQQSYIKTASAVEIKCQEKGKYFERNTLFGGVLTDIEERTIYQVQIESLNGKNKRCLELPNKKEITGKILKIPQGPWMDEFVALGIHINDYDSTNDDIDILIGADLIPFLELNKSITLKCGLKAVKTIFGWTVMGPIPVHNNVLITNSMTLAAEQLDDQTIKNLWDLELLGIRDPATIKTQQEKDIEAQLHFNETVLRNEDGRYKIALPWIKDGQFFPNNFGISIKRLFNATKRLQKGNMFKTYDKIFKQWEEEGIIVNVINKNEDMSTMKGHFIPHHPVFKPESRSTPVRPVFDASCKIGRSPSLNECLEKGPNLIELIPKIMIQFRQGKIGVLSDIRKAFQMIEVQEEDQIYLMFLWWEDESCTKIKIFMHKRVVFGVKSSPFILAAVLNHLLDNVLTEDIQVAQKLKKSLYVDNSVTSVNTYEEYEQFKSDATRILADAKMELREWEHSVMEIPGINNNSDYKENKFTSVLGMKWNKKKDTLSCAGLPTIPEQLTKRTLLASVNKIFDPLGFLSPAMVYPKLILQASWAEKKGWDDELPADLKSQFKKWCKELEYLGNIEIPRSLVGKNYCENSSKIQFHIFNDASQVAYATVVFIRIETYDEVYVQLVQAKARIAPLNKMTIPRLELMGSVLGARMAQSLNTSFAIPASVFYWTDSTTVLAWIKRNNEWGTFVGNRVKEIIRLSNTDNWYFIPGKLNPADMPSRGCSPKDLLKSKWWEGPDWLKLPKAQWPNESFTVDEDAVSCEKKKTSSTTVIKNSVEIINNPWFDKKQSYTFCLRILAWVRRFKNNCLAQKRNLLRQSGNLSPEELNSAEVQVVGWIQQQVFPQDSNFIEGLRVSKTNKDNIYFVTTKLLNRQDTGRFKQPLLLPHAHPIVDKIIEEEHQNYGHAGAQFLVAKLREKFWIIKTRKAVKRIIKACVTCKKYGAAAASVPMAPLPENRVKDAKVFEVSGIDLAGPLHLKDNSKIWVVIFTCAIYRAVHIESVERINTEEFIMALSRFTYKRGRSCVIYTDNGTNFVKAADLFGKLNWEEIQAKTKTYKIKWIFNPPASPWWGGFWERLVRSLKEYLRKILGQNKLNKVELDTTLAFVQSLLNSRPLTYVTEDPEDLIPLTPNAFIQDIETNEFPEIIVLNQKGFRQKYKELLQLKEELRSRFRSEYLGQLVQRAKPTVDFNFDIGDLVFVVDDKKKRLEWSMAKTIELFPGKDQERRVARIKTSNGELIRSLQRLIPLEIKSTEIQSANRLEVVKKAKENQSANELEVVKKATKVQKKRTSKETTLVKEDGKEVITRSGRVVKAPLRLHFN